MNEKGPIIKQIDYDSYTDFMTSNAIRHHVMKYINNLPEEKRDDQREKLKVLYKMGVSWKGIQMAMIGIPYESKD
jgi:hypothetical protein